MNERDRLAADLYNAVVNPNTIWWDDLPPEMQAGWLRAIALGWTRLDEERLARALVGPMTPIMEDLKRVKWNQPWRYDYRGEWTNGLASAIAKAYREDTE